MQQYGTKEEAGAFVLMSIESGPLVTMMILGTTGLRSFSTAGFRGGCIAFCPWVYTWKSGS
ncbi:MAG: 2-keto-3-deoxygluconate permease [Thermoactinomyces sp.]